MKLAKKSLIVILSVSWLASTIVTSTEKPQHEVTLLADENTESSGYEKGDQSIIRPKSTNTVTVA